MGKLRCCIPCLCNINSGRIGGTTIMLAVLAVICHLAGQGTQALPVQAPPILITIDRRTLSSCDDSHHCRTILNIISSCLATVFLCVWVAIHPNIPAPDEG